MSCVTPRERAQAAIVPDRNRKRAAEAAFPLALSAVLRGLRAVTQESFVVGFSNSSAMSSTFLTRKSSRLIPRCWQSVSPEGQSTS
jgi:hypothetical protein